MVIVFVVRYPHWSGWQRTWFVTIIDKMAAHSCAPYKLVWVIYCGLCCSKLTDSWSFLANLRLRRYWLAPKVDWDPRTRWWYQLATIASHFHVILPCELSSERMRVPEGGLIFRNDRLSFWKNECSLYQTNCKFYVRTVRVMSIFSQAPFNTHSLFVADNQLVSVNKFDYPANLFF